MSNYNVYALGNALLDIEYHSSNQQLEALKIDKGVMTLIEEKRQIDLMAHLGDSHQKMACGGSSANSIIALSDFGGKAYFSCSVADDMSGQVFIKGLKDSAVESNVTQHLKNGHTGKCLVFVTPDADRTMNTYLGASAHLNESSVNATAIQNSEYVYIEGYLVTGEETRAAAVKVRETAEKHHVKTSITLSDPAMVEFFRDGLLEMIGEGVNLLFANEEEAQKLTQKESFSEVITEIQKYCKQFAITRGANGAVVFDGENLLTIKGHDVEAIDTLGAGDSFAGAFLYAVTHGMDFKQAGELASLTSAKIVTQYGPRLSKDQIKAVLNEYKAGN